MPPLDVNLIALDNRFITTYLILLASDIITVGTVESYYSFMYRFFSSAYVLIISVISVIS